MSSQKWYELWVALLQMLLDQDASSRLWPSLTSTKRVSKIGFGKQLSQPRIKSFTDLKKCQDRNIVVTSLDSPKMGAIDIGPERKLFLR